MGISKNIKIIVIASRSLAKSRRDPLGTSVASLSRNDDTVFRDTLMMP